MSNWYASYSSAGPYGKVSATIYPAGESVVTLTATLGPRQEIGEYRHRLPPEVAERVRDVIGRSNYASLPDPGPQRPGTKSMFLAEGVEGSVPTTQRWFPLHRLPDALQPVVQTMDQVIDQIRAHPYRVLAGEAAFEQPEARPDAELAIGVTLRHRGTAPFEIANPAADPETVGIAVMLRVTPDKPEADIDEDDIVHMQLERGDISVIPRPGAEWDEAGPRVQLASGDELRLRVTKRLRLRPGRYRAVLMFNSTERGLDPDRAIAGSLLLNPGPLTIRG